MNCCQIAFLDKNCCQQSCYQLYWFIVNWCQEASYSTMNRRNKQAFAQFLIACTCWVSKIGWKNCWWCWGLQDEDPLWREMSKQHGVRHNSWLSPSRIPVHWSTQACHHCCWFWIGVYAKPLCPENECATRIQRWRRILQRPPMNYLWLSLQRAFKGLNG